MNTLPISSLTYHYFFSLKRRQYDDRRNWQVYFIMHNAFLFCRNHDKISKRYFCPKSNKFLPLLLSVTTYNVKLNENRIKKQNRVEHKFLYNKWIFDEASKTISLRADKMRMSVVILICHFPKLKFPLNFDLSLHSLAFQFHSMRPI